MTRTSEEDNGVIPRKARLKFTDDNTHTTNVTTDELSGARQTRVARSRPVSFRIPEPVAIRVALDEHGS